MGKPVFEREENPLRTIVELSRYYGQDKGFVIGGGGNTSVKIGDSLFIKASGIELGSIDEDGFVELDRKKLDKVLEYQFSADRKEREEEFKRLILSTRVYPEKNQRPSVESIMHHIIPDKFVVHIHPTIVNMLSCCVRGKELCKDIFGNDILWIDYVDPGVELGRKLKHLFDEYLKINNAQPGGIILQNHGLVVADDDANRIVEKIETIFEKIKSILPEELPAEPFGKIEKIEAERKQKLINIIGPALRGILGYNSDTLAIVNFDDGEDAVKIACGVEGKRFALGGPLSPDHIVYGKSFPAWVEIDSDDEDEVIACVKIAIEDYKAERGYEPAVVIVKGLGVFCIGNNSSRAQLVRNIYNDGIKVMIGAKVLGGVKHLTKEEYGFIESWEAEAYRLRALKGAEIPSGRVGGKVVIITGGARGVGAEIAEHILADGGYVVIGDVNEEGAKENAERLSSRFGEGRAFGFKMDVTDGDSVAEVVHQAVRIYGGFDVFISNAGVLKAGSVKTQPIEDFDFVTNVNYKGYFVCVQKASPILAVQHKVNPEYWSDIIQINSKSGLAGSNRNGAYAGSKFGGIGLTQSFALELVEDGIKVNSICPGNFLDSPLWSDPENGLFVQYLRAGKVPGAKTVEDVRKFYEDKVPMKRGCRISDLMKAIYYVIEQKYETGQAIPVTGGQIMLR